MKKIVYCLLAMLFSIFCFSACGGGDNKQESTGGDDSQSTIAFVNNEITLAVGESVQAEVITANSNIFVFWSIRDSHIATISSNGVITGVQEGQTICWAEFGGEKAVCMVTVTAKEAEPMLSVTVPYEDNNVTLYVGDTVDLKASVKLGDTTIEDAQVTYEVSQSGIVSVENGKITGTAAGETIITISANYQGKSTSVVVNVTVVNKA